MRYSVYADMSRPLTPEERNAVAAALEAQVPHSGCVGPQEGSNDEAYYAVEADTDEDAIAQATRYAALAIRMSGVDVKYTLEVQALDGGLRKWKI